VTEFLKTWSYLHVHVSFSMWANSSTVIVAPPWTAPLLQLAIIMLMLWIEIGLPFYFGQLKHSCNNVIPDRNTSAAVAAQLKSQDTVDGG